MRARFVSVLATLLAVALTTAQSFGVASVRFAPAVPYSAGATANSVVSVDLNGDGFPDMVVATNDGVSVLLNNGDGTFAPSTTYATGGTFSNSVAVADVNLDGIPDLVVTNMCLSTTGCSGVAVLIGTGLGTFQSAVGYNSGGLETGAVAIGDFNNDGAPDLILTSNCQPLTCAGGFLTLLLNNGNGTYGKPINLNASKGGPVAVADINNDGNQDLITGSGVMLGNGDGTFNPLGQDVPAGAVSIVVADINNDGNLDVVVAVPTGVAVQLGNGDGTFQPALNFKSGGVNPLSVAVADFNGDNKPDIAVANECLQYVKGVCAGVGMVGVLAGNGNGTFLAPVTFTSGGQLGTSVAAIDVNGDTKIDLLASNVCITAANCNDGSVGVLINNFTTTTTIKVVSSLNPALINQAVTFTATVSSSSTVPDGTDIVFFDGANQIGDNTTVNGVTSLTTSFATSGGHSIKAVFSGDLYHSGSTGTAAETVNRVPSVAAVTSSLNPSTYGQAVSLIATVTSSLPSVPTGTVTFMNGTAVLGTVTLDGTGTATLTKSNLAAGTLSITAVYNGDFETLKSTSPVYSQTVNQASTSTTVISSLNPSTVGRAVKFTATVTSTTTTPTGSVTFMDGTTPLATVNLSLGTAAYTTSALAAGSHNITAVYNGTVNIATSTSAVLVQTVN